MGSPRRSRRASSISTVSELRRFTPLVVSAACIEQSHWAQCDTRHAPANVMRAPAARGAGRCVRVRAGDTSTHRLETLLTQCSAWCSHPLAADPLLCAAGVGRRLHVRKEQQLRQARVRSSPAARCAREWLCSLPGCSWCCCLAALPAPPALLPMLPSALLRRRRCVCGRPGWRVHLLHRQERPDCQPDSLYESMSHR
jgi:hypothetical protein